MWHDRALSCTQASGSLLMTWTNARLWMRGRRGTHQQARPGSAHESMQRPNPPSQRLLRARAQGAAGDMLLHQIDFPVGVLSQAHKTMGNGLLAQPVLGGSRPG